MFFLNAPLGPPLLCAKPASGGRSGSDGRVRGEFRWGEEGKAGWWHQSETEGVGAEDWRSVVWDCCWCKVWSVCHFDSLSTVFGPVRCLTCCWDLARSVVRSGKDSLVSCCPELTSLAAGTTATPTVAFTTKMLGLLRWLPAGLQTLHFLPLRVPFLYCPAAPVHMKGCCPI